LQAKRQKLVSTGVVDDAIAQRDTGGTRHRVLHNGSNDGLGGVATRINGDGFYDTLGHVTGGQGQGGGDEGRACALFANFRRPLR